MEDDASVAKAAASRKKVAEALGNMHKFPCEYEYQTQSAKEEKGSSSEPEPEPALVTAAKVKEGARVSAAVRISKSRVTLAVKLKTPFQDEQPNVPSVADEDGN
jgi:hypothetical protein